MKHMHTVSLWSLRFFLAILIVFVWHRSSTFDALGGMQLPTLHSVQAFAVGLMSDIWIAAIASFLYWLAAAKVHRGADHQARLTK
jgi:ABC-type nitrate/sulfonate/bicarbonate transport system permease component